MHRVFLLHCFELFVVAANPLLIKKQTGPNGALSKQDLNSINNCLNPEGGIAPKVVRVKTWPSFGPLLTWCSLSEIYRLQAEVYHGRNWTMWPAHVAERSILPFFLSNNSRLTAHQCRAYCQVSVSWDYGLESQFDDTTCQQNDPVCTISDTQTTAVTNSKSFNVGIQLDTRSLDPRDDGLSLQALKATFSAGATWGWSDTYSNATAIATSRPTDLADKCGYWTFVPYMVT